MKKYVLSMMVLIATLTSCSVDDEGTAFHFEIMPIVSVEMPEEFEFGETYEIFMDYVKPSSCYVFNDFLYQINGQERTVGIINTVYTEANCEEEPETVTVSFKFLVTSLDTYVFKFYQGEDEAANGVDQYLIIEVPVVEQ
jgi:hypothetical protein